MVEICLDGTIKNEIKKEYEEIRTFLITVKNLGNTMTVFRYKQNLLCCFDNDANHIMKFLDSNIRIFNAIEEGEAITFTYDDIYDNVIRMKHTSISEISTKYGSIIFKFDESIGKNYVIRKNENNISFDDIDIISTIEFNNMETVDDLDSFLSDIKPVEVYNNGDILIIREPESNRVLYENDVKEVFCFNIKSKELPFNYYYSVEELGDNKGIVRFKAESDKYVLYSKDEVVIY